MIPIRIQRVGIVVLLSGVGLIIFACTLLRQSVKRVKTSQNPVLEAAQKLGDKLNWYDEAGNLLHTTSDRVTRMKKLVDALDRSSPSRPSSPAASLKHGFVWELSQSETTTQSRVADAEDEFYQYISKIQLNCPQSVRIGTKEDGGWDACLTGPYNITRPCLVYSIGMGGEWSFDNMITDKYGCKDMAYDPTLGKADHKPTDLLWFYNTGLAGVNKINDQKWRVRTFSELLRENGHSNTTIDILKIDIEYAEWESFEAMLNDTSLSRVKQLMFEFHTKGLETSIGDLAYYRQILRGIDVLGFKSWRFWENNAGRHTSKLSGKSRTCCGNVNFVNVKYIS